MSLNLHFTTRLNRYPSFYNRAVRTHWECHQGGKIMNMSDCHRISISEQKYASPSLQQITTWNKGVFLSFGGKSSFTDLAFQAGKLIKSQLSQSLNFFFFFFFMGGGRCSGGFSFAKTSYSQDFTQLPYIGRICFRKCSKLWSKTHVPNQWPAFSERPNDITLNLALWMSEKRQWAAPGCTCPEMRPPPR